MLRKAVLFLVLLLVAAGVAGGAAYALAGRGEPPRLTINKPGATLGRTGTLDVSVGAPGGRLSALTVTLEQNGRQFPLFALTDPAAAAQQRVDGDTVHVSRSIDATVARGLSAGPARIVVAATRPSWLNLRPLSSRAEKTITVRLDPPRINVVSTHHYVNHGGSEMVVYRISPPDVASGVRVGDVEYRGYALPAGAGAPADQGLRVAFFALLYDQPLSASILAFARDEVGNEATARFVDNVFEKPFKKSRIPIDDRFLGRVVPEILEHSPELKVQTPSDLVPAFLQVNGALRRMNAERISALTSSSGPPRLWDGPFVQLGNSQVEASFADHRTYLYNGREIDQQDHLGFDLAVTANVPVVAANTGTVVQADWLGIYGNCVIIDHGLGVASLYGHLSSIGVRAGETVTKGQVIGKSGMTGLAGGDHLHFTMLVGGHPVNPVEWWDRHWMEDRVERKLHETGSPSGR
jgi:murein DD-endopeptidase MepM/ murein hydrolase activator NlpD